ncbi:VPS41 family protein [Megaselia abdita]
MEECESATEENETETDSSSEEEIEPKFKYVRIANDLQNILNREVVVCSQVNSKFLLFGTFLGAVYLLDHQGNQVESSLHQDKKYSHKVAVNGISTDAREEHVASCSDDGHAIITGLFSDSNNQDVNVEKPVKSIALDPDPKSPSVKRFIIGDDCLTLYEKTFFKGLNKTVLSRAEGFVTAIAWNGQFVAWASHTGVRIYDLKDRCSLGLMSWEVPHNGELKNFRCNLRWTDGTTLLVGWVDTIRVCKIRKRNSIESIAKSIPNYVVDPVSTFQTSFFVCGLAPLASCQLVVLGYPKEKDPETNKAQRPVLCVLEYKGNNYEEVCTDCLSLRGYQEYKVNHYNLEYILEENRYFIVAPKDIVVAILYDTDDRVHWLLEHKKFEEAIDVISVYSSSKYSMISVARLNVDHLLRQGKYDEAAKLCLRALGNNKSLWEEEVYKFLQYKQLRSVSSYLPRTDDCKLNPEVYEMVLYEYLRKDVKGLIELIKEWPPSLYNTTAVINAIKANFDPKESGILQESLAILYTHEKRYDKALQMYLKLQNKDVFDLIRNRNLYGTIQKEIIALIHLDREKAISLLIEKNKISPSVVVKQLEKKEEYLYWVSVLNYTLLSTVFFT